MKNLINHFIESHNKTTINSTDKIKRPTYFFLIIYALIVLQHLLRLLYLLPFRSVTINKDLFTFDNTIIMISPCTYIIWVSIMKSETNFKMYKRIADFHFLLSHRSCSCDV